MTATPLATTDALFFDRPGAGIGRAEAEPVEPGCVEDRAREETGADQEERGGA